MLWLFPSGCSLMHMTQHSWPPRVDCNLRMAYLGCLSRFLHYNSGCSILLVDMSIWSYEHPLNCSLPKFPLVLITPLGIAYSGPNKVSPFKPTCQALHPHSLSLPLSRTSVFCTTAEELVATQQVASARETSVLWAVLLCVRKGYSPWFSPFTSPGMELPPCK